MLPARLPLLFSFRRCPYAIRARLALHIAGVPFELREVALRHKPPEMLARSPKGTVPVLCLPNDTVIDESLDIMHWALARHDPEGWLTQASPQLTQALIEANDLGFKTLLDRYKYPERHPEQTQEAWRTQAEQAFLAPLAERLQTHTYLLSNRPSLADMAILPFIRQFAQVDRAWWDSADLAALRRWLETLTGSALFEAVMAKPPEPPAPSTKG